MNRDTIPRLTAWPGWPRMFATLLIIDIVLVLILAAGAAVTFLRGDDVGAVAPAGAPHETDPREYGGPDRPGRFVASLPEPLRTIFFQLDLDKEGNFASVFSALHFLAIGLLAMLLALDLGAKRPILRSVWICLSAGFLVLFLDEAFSFHSAVSPQGAREGAQPIVELVGADVAFFLFFLLPLACGAAILIFTCAITFAHAPQRRFMAYGAVFAWIISLFIDATSPDLPTRWYRIASFAEESLEIGGSLLIIIALFLHIRKKPHKDTD